MTVPPLRLHVEAWSLCPQAQRVKIAAGLRGLAVVHRVTSGGEPQSTAIVPTVLTLSRAGLADHVLTDGLAMVELVEDLFPAQSLHPRDAGVRAVHRELMALGAEAQTRLSRATRERNPQDLDLALGGLQARLARIETLLAAHAYRPGHGLSNVDVVLAPTLWRLQILDGQVQSHLLSGHPRLRHWAEWLVGQPVVRDTLSAEAADLYFAVLHARRAAIVNPDIAVAWRALMGPEIGLRGAG
ncbi:glutathione S-transferase family protein [Paragemmobacter straminiformis]|uniref:Glutathione S-transferase family protein n=1 Tax=Paragemmobacter straminiformis TaxID=2045119 RepID=A0A842I9W9_9RHOB|nr:glutathione S-transferase domain-containing protein [Gemmobacter straminiformis]MBC2836842.1 glutathione S-transferase family protein [Gemmobacter straminiformis]